MEDFPLAGCVKVPLCFGLWRKAFVHEAYIEAVSRQLITGPFAQGYIGSALSWHLIPQPESRPP